VKRGWVYQAALLAAAGLVLWFFVSNTAHNLESRRIASGFGFLWREAGFEIGETGAIAYDAADNYLRALGVGLWNTVRVAAIGVVCATLLGTLIGLARLSPNWLLARLAAAYVETIRNVPLLVQLFFWYAIISENLPGPQDALQPFPGAFLSNRGIALPTPWSTPVLSGFNFTGGMTLTPEFAALLTGLVLYTAAFIAEVVRAGIAAVSRGQTEAAYSLGLRPRPTLRLIVVPQAMRVIIPPLTSQYLNLTKNSTLAVAIGYPDLVQVFTGTVLNQTGQAVEVVAITMAVYLTISLTTSLLMNFYNSRIALVER